VCGNYNAPCNFGEYVNDAPQKNYLIVANGKQPVAKAKVEVFSARPYHSGYNVETYLKDPDAIYFTDQKGKINIGHFPFSPDWETFNGNNGVLLLKIGTETETYYRFFEITEFNEAFWAVMGGEQEADILHQSGLQPRTGSRPEKYG
jgi:hypothetical protein